MVGIIPLFYGLNCLSIGGIRMGFWKLRSSLLFAGMMIVSSPALSLPPTSTEQTLRLLSVELMEAVEKKDKVRLEDLLATDFALRVPGEAKVTGKSEWLANAVGMDWSDFRYENVVVRVNGDSATVSSRLRFQVSPFPFGLDSGVVDTWVRRDGRWLITGRYLGESRMQQRITFAAGVLSTLLLTSLAFASVWLARRVRRRNTN